MNDRRPIGIFDSGVGGLSILSSVKKLLPNESFIYVADQANNPYGGKTEKQIRDIAMRVASFLVKQKVKLIIIACNTASVTAIDNMRRKFDIPIIAVVPVVKTVSEATKTGKAVVLSTPATAGSKYLQGLIDKFSKGKQIIVIGTSKLEHLVEDGIIEGPGVEDAIKKSFASVGDKDFDCIALGCTHYPFLTGQIQKIVGPKVAIFDSGGAVARQTKRVLENEGMLSDQKESEIFYTTGDPAHFKVISEKLLKEKLVDVRFVAL